MPAISRTPLTLSFHHIERVTPQGDGTVVASHSDGTVVSIQPDGSMESRPAGTAGPYERAVILGDKLVYHSGGRIYTFAYLSELPNE